MTMMGSKTRQRKRPTAAVESGVCVPPFSTTLSYGKPISVAGSIRALEPGQSFRVDDHKWRRRITATASQINIPVKTNRLPDGKLLVTRLEVPTEA